MNEREHDAESSDAAARTRRRRNALLNHMLAYFAAGVILVPVNFLTTPGHPWFIYPMVAWLAPLAIHVAYAMGLLDGVLGRRGQGP